VNDFYIGYLPKVPPALARRIRRSLFALAVMTLAVATALVTGERQFDAASFEYGKPRSFRGVVEATPIPVLRVKRPGTGDSESRYPLVGAGKHGVGSSLAVLDGREVELRGMLIFRDGVTLLELVPGSAKPVSNRLEGHPEAMHLGVRTLIGEIVDTKCYAGVMNPGQGKVHRDCAARCIGGGIPPALLSDGTLYYLIEDGKPAPLARLQEYISRPVVLSGQVSRIGETYYLTLQTQGIACARVLLKQ